ncbi:MULTISPECIES: calcium:proton antiporter [unclassified Phyllobacterium]|uniref:calcium:proton antiporter n=1 Tax=unclassified Phyllobacterium TaxID=2638441 RepID=UPI003013138F
MIARPLSLFSYAVPAAALLIGATLRVTTFSASSLSLVPGALFSLATLAVLFTTVFVVLHHAEVLAAKLGQPFGTLLLTLSVTTVEVAIIVSLMLHGENNPTLARESVFSTVMIVCAGVVGLCLVLGGLNYHQQDLKRQGTSAFLSVLMALAVLTLILPNFTLSNSPGSFSTVSLFFVSLCSILLYGAFLFTQTVRHRDDFLTDLAPPEHGHRSLSTRASVKHAFLLIIGLVGVVLLAEEVSAAVENGLAHLHVEQTDAIIGAFIATLVLLPEAISAVQAALKNELQRSLNIALGSALATIGLTVPAVAIASILTGRELILGLSSGDTVLLVLVLAVSMMSFGTGRTNLLNGLVHLVVFVAFILLVAVP